MIYAPIERPDDWQRFLADPEKQWREGYSAHMIAHTWQNANGFPMEVQRLFVNTSDFSSIEPLLILPEHKVPLPGGSRPSQNDIWILAKAGDKLVSISVEGKVKETFGPTVAEWSKDASHGKKERLGYLCRKLGIEKTCDGDIRYQLLHRTASAIIEAERFMARHAIMLVHSFSTTNEGSGDYYKFANQIGVAAKLDEIVHVGTLDGIELHIGWVSGKDAVY